MTNKHGVDDLMEKLQKHAVEAHDRAKAELEAKTFVDRIALGEINISPPQPTELERAMALADRLAPRKETINHPDHYGGDTVYETIKVLKAWYSMEEYRGFLIGNAIKYLSRAGKKGNLVEDLKKAQWYINKLIEDVDAGV